MPNLSGTKLNPHPMNAGPMIEGLRSGKLDIAFIGHICPELDKEFDSFEIYSVPLRIVVAGHHLLAKRTRIGLPELADSPLISFTAGDFPVGRGLYARPAVQDQTATLQICRN